ncbi:MAG: hypothetical protein ACR2OJ_15695 [Hyphomicrobiales bacterium]
MMLKKLSWVALFLGLSLDLIATSALASSKYANWVRHGDTYVVNGVFGEDSQTFRVKIVKKGRRFVVRTPLGDYALAPKGRSVAFRIRIDKAWARITWRQNRATVRYKNKTGRARVRRQGR